MEIEMELATKKRTNGGENNTSPATNEQDLNRVVQSFRTPTNEEIDLAINKAGFTETITQLFQEQFTTLQEKEIANKAIIATRMKMWQIARQGSVDMKIKGSAKKMTDLAMPFTAYYEGQDPPTKKLLELMNTFLDKSQLIEILTTCIKNELKGDNITTQTHNLEPTSQPSNKENTKHYYRFPPLEIPLQTCDKCISRFADKFFCVGCYLIFDSRGKFLYHRKNSKECDSMCRNWQTLRFEAGHEFEHKLIYAQKERRPRAQ